MQPEQTESEILPQASSSATMWKHAFIGVTVLFIISLLAIIYWLIPNRSAQNTLETNTTASKSLKPTTEQIQKKGPKVSKDSFTLAPEIVGITKWINTDPLSIQDLRGKVVVMYFCTPKIYTYCVQPLPELKKWHELYSSKGLVVLGINTPYAGHDRAGDANYDVEGQAFVNKNAITFPYAQDTNETLRKAYNISSWPDFFVIDKEGYIRKHHQGAGSYYVVENEINTLLAE